MDNSLKKSLVTVEQLNCLLDFMKEHPDVAKGLRRGRRGKLMTLKIWAACAKKLNAVPGAVKDGKGWSKYWCDWKYRVRRRALEHKAAKDSEHPPPEPPTPLTDIDETIISIIGENSLEHVVIKTNPLDDDSNEEMVDQNEYNDTTTEQHYVTRKKRRKRRRSSNDQYDGDDHSEEPCSSPKIKSSPVDEELESEDEASQFLQLERQKLDISYKTLEALQSMTKQLERVADVLCDVKDKVLDKFL